MIPPGDPCQPPTGRLSLCSAPTNFRCFSICQVLYSSDPDPRLHPRIISPHHGYLIPSPLAELQHLSKLSCARPFPQSSSLRVSVEQWSQDSLMPRTFPSPTLHVCILLPEAGEVKSELGSDSATCHHSLPHSHNTLVSQGLGCLAIS